MKKVLIALSFALLSSLIALPAKADSDDGKREIPLLLGGGSSQSGKPHRSLSEPIECYYQYGVLYFTTLEDLGEAEIVVENAETGLVLEETLYGVDATTVNITGATGSVYIYITTDNASYYGELSL